MTAPNLLRILFADDEDTFRLSVKKALSDIGYVVTAVDSGEEAVHALSQQKFDVVILDFKMSGISGLNVLHYMHEQKDDTPVIMLTGMGSENVAVEVLKLGAYDYIRKEHLELKHLPIIINGVYERYLFRKDKAHAEQSLRERDQLASLIESFQAAFGSLAQVVNNSLAMLYLNICEFPQSLLPHVEGPAKETFRAAFQELDKEYNLVASSVKTLLNLTAALQDKLADRNSLPASRVSLNDEIELTEKGVQQR